MEEPAKGTVSLGYQEDEFDFILLATVNNNMGLISNSAFQNMVRQLQSQLKNATGKPIQVINRQDAEDIVMLEPLE